MAFDRIISRLVGRIADEVDTTPQPAVESAVPFTQRLAKNLSRIADNLDSLGTEVSPNPGGPTNPVLSSIRIGENNFDVAGAGGVPLPSGTAALDQLRWNAGSNAWEASSGTFQTYSVLVATNDPDKVVEAVHHYETNGFGSAQPTFSVQRRIDLNLQENASFSFINMVWADDAAANPWLFGIVPNWTDYVGYIPDGETDYAPNYTPFYQTGVNDPATHPLVRHDQPTPATVLRNFLRVNGVSFDAVRAQIVGPRPVDLDDYMGSNPSRGIMGWFYTRPPAVGTTVSLIQQTARGLGDSMPPMLLSAVGSIRHTGQPQILLTFNELLDINTAPAEAIAFSVQGDGADVKVRSVTFLDPAPTTLIVYLVRDRENPITDYERVTIQYAPQITDGDLKDLAGNRVAGFSNVTVDFSRYT